MTDVTASSARAENERTTGVHFPQLHHPANSQTPPFHSTHARHSTAQPAHFESKEQLDSVARKLRVGCKA
jgi:hypothetical protein